MIFLIKKTVKVNLLSATRLTSRNTTQIINALSSKQTKYETKVFKITDIHGEKN